MRFLRFKIGRRSYIALFPLSFILVLIIWVLLSYTGLVKDFFLPTPLKIIQSTYALFSTYNYIGDIWASVYRVLIGFGLSALIGVPLGLVMGVNKHIEASVEPFIDFTRYMPVAGFIPLCILWLGIGDAQKIAIIFIGTFFQLVPMVMNATSSIPEEFLDTSRTLGAKDFFILRRVVIPYSLPEVYDSLRVSIGISWTYLVVAEIVASATGIGHVIIEAQRYLKTPHIFVGILTVGFLGLVTDYLFKIARPLFFPWTAQRENTS